MKHILMEKSNITPKLMNLLVYVNNIVMRLAKILIRLKMLT